MNAEVKEARKDASGELNGGRPRAGSRGPALPSGPRSGLPSSLRKPPSLSTLAMPSFAGARVLSDETLAKIATLVAQLPPHNRDLLYTVVELIRATAAAVKETKMTLGNLLLVFCPSLSMSPPLLRVLCEAEKIWESSPNQTQEPAVLDIAAPVLEISTPSEATNQSNSPAQSNVADEGKGEHDADVNSGEAIPRPGAMGRHPVSTFYASALEIPTAATALERLSSSSNSGQDDSASYVSARETSTKSNSATSSLADSPRVPPLSSSTDSLATPSTMSENPSFSSAEPISRHESTGKSEPIPAEDPQVAESEELSLPSSRLPIISAPIPFPATDPAPQPSLMRRKSYNLLSFPPLRSDSNNYSSSPSSPTSQWARRNSRPSLRLLFSKKSSSSLNSPPSALPTAATYYDSAFPHSAVEQEARAATPPVLTTNIPSSPIRLFTPSWSHTEHDTANTDTLEPPPSIRDRVDSAVSTVYSTPEETPITDRRLSVSKVFLTVEDPRSISPSDLPRSPSRASLSPSIDIKLENVAEDDWAASVLAAAGSTVASRRITLKEPVNISSS